MRKTKAELDNIKQKYNTDILWSFSRVNCWINDRYEYLLKYLKKIPEDYNTSIYGSSGNAAHDCLESFYTKQITYDEMYERWTDKKDEFLLLDLKFNKSDEDKNEKIQNNYYGALDHFFKNHKVIKGKTILEYFLPIVVKDNIFQGYIDMISINSINGEIFIDIIDFKTSTMYTKKKIPQEERQLLLYALGVSQKLDIPLSQIRCKWDFLKYVSCQVEKKGKKPKKGEDKVIEYKNRYIKRNEIGNSLVSDVKMWAKTLGYTEEEIEGFIDDMIFTNGISCLPEDIQSKFTFDDAFLDIEVSQEKIDTLVDELCFTIDEIKSFSKTWEQDKDDSKFEYEVTKDQEFRLSTLCGYSEKYHIPLQKYREKQALEELEKDNVVIGGSDELDEWLTNL